MLLKQCVRPQAGRGNFSSGRQGTQTVLWSRFKILVQESSRSWPTASSNHSLPRRRKESGWGSPSAVPSLSPTAENCRSFQFPTLRCSNSLSHPLQRCFMTEPVPIVFVVDDDPSVCRAIKRLVESVGLHVEMFGSASEFMSSSRPEIASCLVLDIRLPGIGGLDFQRELAGADIHIPIIFITGHGDIPMSVRAMKAGAVEFLTKPFRDQDLLDAIQVGLARDRARRQRQSETAVLRERFESLTPREREG